MVNLEEARQLIAPGESPDYGVLLDTARELLARELLAIIESLTIIDCHHCTGSGYFCVETTGEMVPCEYCGAVGKQVLQVKSYTEDELVDRFAKENGIQLDDTGNWHYEDWKAAQTLIENARFLGVLKPKEKL